MFLIDHLKQPPPLSNGPKGLKDPACAGAWPSLSSFGHWATNTPLPSGFGSKEPSAIWIWQQLARHHPYLAIKNPTSASHHPDLATTNPMPSAFGNN